MARRRYKHAGPSNTRPVDAIGVRVPPEDEARSALSARIAELTAAESAQRQHAAQHAAAMAAAAQQRAAAAPMTERQLEWLRAHPETTADELMALKLRVAVMEARRAGLEDDSPEFYHFIEQRLGYQPDAHEPVPEPVNGGTPMPHYPPPPARRGPPVSAPVSRSGGVGVGGAPVAPGRIHLTAEEREWAQRSGVSDAEYGKNKQRLLAAKRAGNYPDR